MRSRLSNCDICRLSLLIFLSLLVATTVGCPGASSYNNNQPPGSLAVVVSPHSAALQVNTQQQFTATVKNSNNPGVNWTATGGTISASGMYTAPNVAGTFTVTATSQADPTKYDIATLSITTTPPPSPTPTPTPSPTPTPGVSITISPSIINLATGGTQQYTATVLGTSNTAVTWTVSAGTISSSGLYTAPGSAVTATITATSVADSTKSATTTVLVGGAGSPLALAAAAMQPGTWAPLTTNNFSGGNLLRPPDGGSGLEFSERAQWNPVNRTVMILGGSHNATGTTCNSTFLAAYTEATNTWANNLPSPCPNFDDSTGIGSTNLVHPYDHQAVDSKGNLYHRQYQVGKLMVFSQATQSWSQCSPYNTSGLTTNSWADFNEYQAAASLVYFPDRNSLYLLDGDWGLWELPLASGCNGSWTLHASTNGGGFSPQLTGLGSYHNVGQYSALCHCIIIGGNSNQMYKIDASNNITQLAASPVVLGIPQNPGTPVGSIYTVDPASGHFLVWSGNDSDNGKAYDYNPLTDTWTTTGISSPIFPGPEGGVTETVAIPIPQYGVIMFVQAGSTSGGAVYLYKHK